MAVPDEAADAQEEEKQEAVIDAEEEDEDKEAFEEGVAAAVAVEEAENGCCRVQKWRSRARRSRARRRLPMRRSRWRRWWLRRRLLLLLHADKEDEVLYCLSCWCLPSVAVSLDTFFSRMCSVVFLLPLLPAPLASSLGAAIALGRADRTWQQGTAARTHNANGSSLASLNLRQDAAGWMAAGCGENNSAYFVGFFLGLLLATHTASTAVMRGCSVAALYCGVLALPLCDG